MRVCPGNGEYQPRGEHDCWRGALLGDKASCITSSASHMASKEHKQRSFRLFLNLLFLLLNTTKAQTKLRKPQYLRTASTAEQPSIGPAQSSRVHIEVRSCRPQSATTQASKHKQVKCCRESNHVHECFMLFSFLTFVLRKAITICTSVQFIF